MATILLLSGPNLNLLGEREPEHYGTTTLDELVAIASETAAKRGHDVEHLQSNHEGVLVDAIHGARGRCAAIVFNPGAFSHYAYALTDALAMFDGVKIEVHLSNPHAREAWRHHSVISPVVDGTITGLQADGLPPRRSTRPPRCWRSDDMTRSRPHPSPPLDVGPRLGRLQARARRRRDRRAARDEARERALPHRASPARPAAARHAATARGSSPTVATPQRAHEELDAAGVDAEIEIGLTGAAQRELLVGRGRRRLPARARGAQRHLGAADRATPPRSTGVELVPAGELVEALRRVKDAGEIDRIRPRVRDRRRRVPVAAADARPNVRPSASSRSRSSSRCASAARAATASIRSSRPDRTARSRTTFRATASIERNELVVCDFGCIVEGYCSDMTRTVSVGDPGPDARHLYDVVLQSQQAGRGRGRGRRRVRRGRSGVARRHRRRGLGRRVLALDRARCRARDPRGAAGRVDGR